MTFIEFLIILSIFWNFVVGAGTAVAFLRLERSRVASNELKMRVGELENSLQKLTKSVDTYQLLIGMFSGSSLGLGSSTKYNDSYSDKSKTSQKNLLKLIKEEDKTNSSLDSTSQQGDKNKDK